MRFAKLSWAGGGFVAAIMAVASPALATSWSFGASPPLPSDWSLTAKITAVDASKSPGSVAIQIGSDAGNCLAGSWLTINLGGLDSNSQAGVAQVMLAALQSSQASAQSVVVSGLNSGCVAQAISATQ